jgi:predicted nuclease of predicted toxin-antitoxin system
MNRSDLRFLVDFNVGQAVSEYLRTAGYDVSFVGELDPRMDDVDILDLAVREGRIVVTMDTDRSSSRGRIASADAGRPA